MLSRLLCFRLLPCEQDSAYRGDIVKRIVSEGVSRLRTEEYLAARARRANPAKIARILKLMGKGNAPVAGDELPAEFVAKRRKRAGRS